MSGELAASISTSWPASCAASQTDLSAIANALWYSDISSAFGGISLHDIAGALSGELRFNLDQLAGFMHGGTTDLSAIANALWYSDISSAFGGISLHDIAGALVRGIGGFNLDQLAGFMRGGFLTDLSAIANALWYSDISSAFGGISLHDIAGALVRGIGGFNLDQLAGFMHGAARPTCRPSPMRCGYSDISCRVRRDQSPRHRRGACPGNLAASIFDQLAGFMHGDYDRPVGHRQCVVVLRHLLRVRRDQSPRHRRGTCPGNWRLQSRPAGRLHARRYDKPVGHCQCAVVYRHLLGVRRDNGLRRRALSRALVQDSMKL